MNGYLGWYTTFIFTVFLAQHTYSATFDVTVLDKKQRPLQGAVVSFHSPGLPKPAPMNVALNQVDRQFVPQILVVTVGSKIDFFNKDDIKHHVYSFSKPMKKQFRLDKGEVKDHTISKTGTVVLGCNIHDWMLGYVYVLDTPVFGRTDENGRFTAKPPVDGEYTVRIQHPRIRDGRGTIERKIMVSPDEASNITVNLSKSLLPKRDQVPNFDDYP